MMMTDRLEEEKYERLKLRLKTIERDRAAQISKNEIAKNVHHNKCEKMKSKCTLLAEELNEMRLLRIMEDHGLVKYLPPSNREYDAKIAQLEKLKKECELIEGLVRQMSQDEEDLKALNKELLERHYEAKTLSKFVQPENPATNDTVFEDPLKTDIESLLAMLNTPLCVDPVEPELDNAPKQPKFTKKNYPKHEETPTFIPYRFSDSDDDDEEDYNGRNHDNKI